MKKLLYKFFSASPFGFSVQKKASRSLVRTLYRRILSSFSLRSWIDQKMNGKLLLWRQTESFPPLSSSHFLRTTSLQCVVEILLWTSFYIITASTHTCAAGDKYTPTLDSMRITFRICNLSFTWSDENACAAINVIVAVIVSAISTYCGRRLSGFANYPFMMMHVCSAYQWLHNCVKGGNQSGCDTNRQMIRCMTTQKTRFYYALCCMTLWQQIENLWLLASFCVRLAGVAWPNMIPSRS